MSDFEIDLREFKIKFAYEKQSYIISTIYKGQLYKGILDKTFDENFQKYISIFKDESFCTVFRCDGRYILEVSINSVFFDISKKIYLTSEEDSHIDLTKLILEPITGEYIVKELLELDSKKRYIDVDDDLFTLSHINTNIKWDMTLPTIINADKQLTMQNIKLQTNMNSIISKFYCRYPFLKNIDFKNILIAGGCISNLLLGRNDKSSDVDFFVYGLSEEEASKKVYSVVRDILSYENVDLDLYLKNTHNVTIVVSHSDIYNPIKIQFIFRLYKTLSSILHGFDIGSSAVGFNGKEVYFTSLSKFAYENMMNVIDTTRRSTTYEKRLIKYFKRGFGIIVPKLDIHQCNDYINMPYLRVRILKLFSNIIFVKKVYIGPLYYKRFGDNKENQDDYDDETELVWIPKKLEDITKKLLSPYAAKNILDITWMVQNPNTQLTSSFNPIIEDESLWYGKYIK